MIQLGRRRRFGMRGEFFPEDFLIPLRPGPEQAGEMDRGFPRASHDIEPFPRL